MNFSTTGYLFSGGRSSDFFDGKRRSILNQINSNNENQLLNISIEQYSEYLSSYHKVDFPILDAINYSISSFEAEIPASRFPQEFAIFDRFNKTIKKDVISFHVPYEGDISYFNYRPSSLLLAGAPPVTIRDDEFLFEYINFYNKVDIIEKQFKEDLKTFKHIYDALKREFDVYNNTLKDFITANINERRQSLLAKNKFLSAFNVPLKSNSNTAKTFAIPAPALREKIVISKPTASNTNFVPEPTLDSNNYSKILKLINDVGKNFERMPSVYKDKEEEHLRDHILMVLDPNFEYGSASGETFNKSGKTDILLRYDSSVVFVAECKFWRGEQSYSKTIDQLLSYLTWRDSKTAIIIFVPNKDISAVLNTVEEVTPKHKDYITTKKKITDSWIEYVFHLPSDKNKDVIVTALIFHLPGK